MKTDTVTHEHANLTPEQQTLWHADLAALKTHLAEHTLVPLKMGDLFLALRQRWGRKVAVLAREAGVSPFLARQRARIAEAIPSTSPLRDLGLPFSILRLLAPLPDPLPWAEHARALQDKGELRVRSFAHLLEEAGLRHPRPHRPPNCAICHHPIVDETQRLTIRSAEESVTLCSPFCAANYFKKLSWSYPSDPSDPVRSDRGAAPPPPPKDTPQRDSTSQSPSANAAQRDSTSQSPAPEAEKRDSRSQSQVRVEQLEDGIRCVIPGGPVIMTRRRST